jgi:hypothetical protein
MFRGCFIVALLCGVVTIATGQHSTIGASEPDYAGEAIWTTIAWNPVITVPEFSMSTVCSETGRFDQEIPLSAPRVVQFESGIYQLYLYMEPGYHYEVALPGYREKERDDRISPFYQARVLPLTVLSRTSLSTGEHVSGEQDVNWAIARFDSLFSVANMEVLSKRRAGGKCNPDSLIQSMEEAFDDAGTPFFADYRRFRYGLLQLNEGSMRLEELSRRFLGPQVMEWHPGFVELFRAMFRDFIFYYSQTPEGKELPQLINRTQDFQQAREVMLDHPAIWCDTLAEMVLLQEFSELFYSGDFHKEAILIMLDSMSHQAVSENFGLYAAQLQQKLASLVPGHSPPSLSLDDLDGNAFSMELLEGKYTYLLFGTPEHYGCMMEYPFLQSYVEKHSDYLQVITVMASLEKGALKDFMKRNAYSWKVLLLDGQTSVLNDYQIRAYPMAFLIGPDGNILLSPAMLPTDGFEQQLFRIMRSRGEI